jgi:hypothetical protein
MHVSRWSRTVLNTSPSLAYRCDRRKDRRPEPLLGALLNDVLDHSHDANALIILGHRRDEERN